MVRNLHQSSYSVYDGPSSGGKLQTWFKWVHEQKTVWGVDTETLGLDPLRNRVRLIQIGTAEFTGIIDLDPWRLAAYGTVETLDVPWNRPGLAELKAFLEDSSIPKVLQNAQFDLNMLAACGVKMQGNIFDTYIAAKIINNGTTAGNGLGEIVKRELGVELDKSNQKSDWGGELNEEQLKYAALDVNCLPRLAPRLKKKLVESRTSASTTLLDVFQLEMQAVRPIASMQMNGFGFDSAAAIELHKELLAEAAALEKEFLRQLDLELRSRHPLDPTKWLPRLEDGSFNTRKKNSGRGAKKLLAGFNAASEKQMKAAFTNAGIALPPSAKTVGALSLDKTLLAFMRADYKLIDIYMEWSSADTAVSCLETLQKHVHTDGRIHGSYNQLGAATGRMSAREPNLQQVPRSKRFRKLFIPAPGYVLVGGDFSQIELRVVAELSGEPAMIDAYKNERDLHVETAARIVEKAFDMVTDAERQSGKVANFGLIYGAGAPTLRKQAIAQYRIPMTLEEAHAIVNGFRKAYPALYKWQQVEGTARKPAVLTLYGRRRLLVGFNDSYTRRLNTPVQGTAGDIAKIAIVKLWQELVRATIGEAKLIAMVHDELIMEVREEVAEQWAATLKQCMESAGAILLKTVPVVADVKIGRSWAETK